MSLVFFYIRNTVVHLVWKNLRRKSRGQWLAKEKYGQVHARRSFVQTCSAGQHVFACLKVPGEQLVDLV